MRRTCDIIFLRDRVEGQTPFILQKPLQTWQGSGAVFVFSLPPLPSPRGERRAPGWKCFPQGQRSGVCWIPFPRTKSTDERKQVPPLYRRRISVSSASPRALAALVLCASKSVQPLALAGQRASVNFMTRPGSAAAAPKLRFCAARLHPRLPPR